MIGSRCPTQAIIPLRGRGSSRRNPPNNSKLGDSASPVHDESEGTVRRTVSKDAVSAELYQNQEVTAEEEASRR